MDTFALDPTPLRLAAALGGLALALSLERWRPFRRSRREPGHELRNLTLWAFGAVLLLALPFMAALSASQAARAAGIGLLHVASVPAPLAILVTVLVLDATTYALHRLYHRSPALWRLHRVHHSDELLTATTGVRFHPGEVLVSAVVRVPVVVLLGAHAGGIVAFEVLLLAASQLQHANLRLPDRLDARLRRLLVTPNLHRVHHSTRRREADSNFGTLLTLWDRLLATYRPDVAPESVTVGLPDTGPSAPHSVTGLLAMPFAMKPDAPEVSSPRA